MLYTILTKIIHYIISVKQFIVIALFTIVNNVDTICNITFVEIFLFTKEK